MQQTRKRYRAFISYSQKDKRLARKIHRALERYRVPRGVEAPVDKDRRLGRFFRDDEELAGAASLGAALEGALDDSDNLIVVASPNAAQSKWVNEEVKRFKRNPGQRVFACVAGGTPNTNDPKTECFPPALRFKIDAEGNLTDIPDEPLAPDLTKESFARVRARLVAALLGLPFDTLWRRDSRRRKQQRLVGAALAIVVACGLGATWVYVDRQQQLATSRGLAADSERLVAQNPVAALDLAIKAADAAQTTEAHNALTRALGMQRTKYILRHLSPVSDATFSPDDTQVLSCLDDGTAVVWQLDGAHVRFQIQAAVEREAGDLHTCVFSPNGTRILTVGRSAGASLWNADDGVFVRTFDGHDGEVYSGRFSPDGAMIVTTGADKTARVWDVKSGEALTTYEHRYEIEDERPVRAIFFPDGKRVVSVGEFGRASVWEVESGATLATFGEPLTWLNEAVLSPDGTRLLISNFQYGAYLWDTNDGRLVGSGDPDGLPLTARTIGAAFSSDSSLLVLGSQEGEVTVWETGEGFRVKGLLHDDIVASVLFSPNGAWIVTADRNLNVWDVPELGGGALTKIFSLPGDPDGIRLAEFSSDGALLLTIDSSDNSVRVWDLSPDAVEAVATTRSGALAYSFEFDQLLEMARSRVPSEGSFARP